MTNCGTSLDTRIDSQLLALNQKATRSLPTLFADLKVETVGGIAVRPHELWLAYFAVEMYGNADSAIIAITHNRARSARILERQMYEMMKRAQYYAGHPEEARLEYLSMPLRDKKLQDDLGTSHDTPYYRAMEQAIRAVRQRFPEVDGYIKEHPKETSFFDMVTAVDRDDARHQYGFHYRRVSQTPHASVVGFHDVFDFRADGNVGLRFDGRLEDPNFSVQLMTIYLIGFLELVNEAFGRGQASEVEKMKAESEDIMARLRPTSYAEAQSDAEQTVED